MNDNHKFWQAGNMQIDEMEAAEGKIPMTISSEVETIALPVDALQGGWISVDDRLPTKYVEVLVYPYPTDYARTAVYGTYNKNGTDLFHYGEYQVGYGHEYYECKPTHWMPLPDAPLMDIKD